MKIINDIDDTINDYVDLIVEKCKIALKIFIHCGYICSIFRSISYFYVYDT